MKKEVGVAIFFGVGLGLFVAFIMVFQIRKIQPKETMVSPTPRIQPKQEKTDSTFQIDEPKPDTISTKKTITIKGKAEKDALLVIQSPLDETTVKLTSDTFSVPFDLAIGENVINITEYPSKQSSPMQQKTIVVYYLDEQ